MISRQCSVRFLTLASLVSVLKIPQAITQGLVGIFTLRTFAIYHSSWVILSVLTILGVSRLSLGLVSITSLGSCSLMFLMRLHSLTNFSRPLLRYCPLHFRNLDLASPLLLQLIEGMIHCWCICLSAYTTHICKLTEVSNSTAPDYWGNSLSCLQSM